jgi:hypothetical protein
VQFAIPISDVVHLNLNDYIELAAWQNGGVTASVVYASYDTFLSVHLISKD